MTAEYRYHFNCDGGPFSQNHFPVFSKTAMLPFDMRQYPTETDNNSFFYMGVRVMQTEAIWLERERLS